MLSGLECSEVMLSQCKNITDFRIDSNTYIKAYMLSEQRLCDIQAVEMKDIILSIQNFGAYSLCNNINFTETGIPFLMTQDIMDNYIDWDNIKHIDKASHQLLYKSHCTKGQVLVTMAGYLGRATVYYEDFVCSSNQAIAKLTLKQGISPFYVSTYINSKYGQSQINRYQTQTAQPNINMSLIKKILVPILSNDFQILIETKILLALSYIKQSKTAYAYAETLLLKSLNLENFEPSKENTSVKTFAETFASGRLDAEYYQKKYDEIEERIAIFPQISIKELINYPICSGSTPKAGSEEYYTNENGIPFIRAVDIARSHIETDNFIYIKPKVHNQLLKRTKLKKNDVLFSIAGTVGRCGIFDYDFEANINQAIAILRFSEEKVKRLYLISFFNSKIGKMIVEKYSRQGLQSNLNLDEVSKLSIPILPQNIQQQISAKVKESFALREQSKRLLKAATRAVEIAIEEGEAAGLEYLKEWTMKR